MANGQPEVLVAFDTAVVARDGSRWMPSACGRCCDDGLWEGWIEFIPVNTAVEPVRSGRETVQPNRADLLYWAQGLTRVYLEGALHRAHDLPRLRPIHETQARPHFHGPAGNGHRAHPAHGVRPVLNPFEIDQQSQEILPHRLSALNPERLRQIAVAYEFASAAAVAGQKREELVALIVGGVRQRAEGKEGRPASLAPAADLP
jgi:hypothetical protein